MLQEYVNKSCVIEGSMKYGKKTIRGCDTLLVHSHEAMIRGMHIRMVKYEEV